MIAVSRCLIGENCTYAGKNNLCKEIKELYDQGLALPLCPEVLGGLPIPRTPCEVTGEKVIDQKGIDRTKEYTQGAKIALDKCLEKNIKIAVLKAKSPSCGKNHIYDGTFSHQLVEGDGIFVQMLKEKGIAVYSENEVTEVFAKEDTTQGVKSDTFEHHVNRMAEAYNKMKNSIEEKYAAQDYEQEYYVTESGKIEELTKEKELDMLNQAYENHSNFMATSTEIWSELQDFTPSVVYHKGSEQTANEQNIGENQENTAKSKEKGVIQNSAYQAFLSAIQSDNQKLSQQYSGDWKDLRLNLNVSDGDRKMLNGIWDYYANKR